MAACWEVETGGFPGIQSKFSVGQCNLERSRHKIKSKKGVEPGT